MSHGGYPGKFLRKQSAAAPDGVLLNNVFLKIS